MDVLSDAISAMRTGRPHASRTRLHGPWGMRFQPQQGAGFHVILQGSCWLLPASGEPVHLGVGDVVFLPRELGHGLADAVTTPLVEAVPEYEDGSPIGSLHRDGPGPLTEMLCGAYRLDQSRLHPLLTELPDVMHIPASIGRHPSLRGAIELLGRELQSMQDAGFETATSALLDVLLVYVLRAWYDSRPGDEATGWGAALRDPAVTAALRAIHQHPATPWTVQSLAARAGLSRAAFAQRFAGKVGAPPLAYLTWWRMTTAARLLRETDLPLRSVAERTGYATEFAFAKAFKREFGTAPGRYRSSGGTSG
ncbi:Transcriptional regulator, AraC family [[Actinomadura] parvosata subsp. kistnae]|uniref:AraC family transcriptional regulator n=1 Tax=[Actinomadura] parvosata subsp. kistnae TaxID=1909395 RepID=A0A1V0A5Y3_9ACTN|nr:AraC family transcriptional regulator [Nonomuraea sp. ATCC 55076]AQZ65614.1 AraC family transcriptional regulator [Nonomuraea sp. ATCC 55076]SPL96996.1 Transcriptional regulator, AraC family [Actinomadura parvosata subsp. kistnae]